VKRITLVEVYQNVFTLLQLQSFCLEQISTVCSQGPECLCWVVLQQGISGSSGSLEFNQRENCLAYLARKWLAIAYYRTCVCTRPAPGP